MTHLQRTKVSPDNLRIVQGYAGEGGEPLFLPDREISRFELLKIALLSSCTTLDADGETPSFSFADVPGVARPRESGDRKLRRRIIGTAHRHGIIQGYPDGTFRPDAPVNSAEALKILFLATRLEPAEDSREDLSGRFSDVPADAWFASYVRQAAEEDIVQGYGDGTFRPAQSITRAEAAKLVYLLMIGNPWVNGYVIPPEGT